MPPFFEWGHAHPAPGGGPATAPKTTAPEDLRAVVGEAEVAAMDGAAATAQ